MKKKFSEEEIKKVFYEMFLGNIKMHLNEKLTLKQYEVKKNSVNYVWNDFLDILKKGIAKTI